MTTTLDSETAARSTAFRQLLLASLQCGAFVSAWVVAWRAYRITYDDRFALDRAFVWGLIAVGLLCFVAWERNSPVSVTRGVVNRALAYVRANPVEVVGLTALSLLGVYVRLNQFGVLPPSQFICCEEHINGGVAWDILDGDRPVAYPLVRYATAFGIWLFGPTTLGLRVAMVAASIAVVPLFYLLMRQVIGTAGAFLATGLLASAHTMADPTSHLHTPMFIAVLLALVTIRALRTGHGFWFVLAGLLAALLSYEYETFKAVPVLLSPFVAFVAMRYVIWPFPRAWSEFGRRAANLVKRAARPLGLFAVAVFIGLGPMLAERHRGADVYFSSLHRQEADRAARGAGGLFAANAETQFKWAVQVFTPVLEPGYPTVGPVAVRPVVDNITSTYVWLGVAAGIAFFWRQERIAFLLWFLGGLAAASLLLANFQAWKLVGFIPPALALAGYVVDDLIAVLKRYAPRLLPLATLALVGSIAGAASLNIGILRANAGDPRVLREFGNRQGQLYALCDYLRRRPSDNYSIVVQRAKSGWGFSHPPLDERERRQAWGDFKFICWGLEGQAVADLQELWPVYLPQGPRDQPVTIVAVDKPDAVIHAAELLRRAIPELPEPRVVRRGPAETFSIIAFETTREVLLSRTGLVLSSLSSPSHRTVADPTAAQPFPAGPFRLSGLVHVPEFGPDPVGLVVEGTISSTVRLDGRVSFDSIDGHGLVERQHLRPGWHVVDIEAVGPVSGPVRLYWSAASGKRSLLRKEDFFALDVQTGWEHLRTFSVDGRVVETMRVDLEPHVAAFDGMRIDAGIALRADAHVTEDRWSARFEVAAGEYLLSVDAAGPARVSLDGRVIAEAQRGTHEVPLSLSAGAHRITLTFQPGPDPVIGGRIELLNREGQAVPMNVRPD